MTETSVKICDPIGRKFMTALTNVAKEAYDEAGLSEEEARRLNSKPELASDIRLFISINRRAPEAFREYPKEYGGPRPIEEQILMLAEICQLDPGQSLEFAKGLPKPPIGSEGWFAVPSEVALACRFHWRVKNQVERHCQAVRFIHEKIGASRPFFVECPGNIHPACLYVHVRTVEAMERIAKQQKGDILIIAAQLGKEHAGCSADDAFKAFKAEEFGLTSFDVGSIALTHPGRFAYEYGLHVLCPGEEAFDSDYPNKKVTSYHVDRDKALVFKFACRSVANPFWGTVTGFPPQ